MRFFALTTAIFCSLLLPLAAQPSGTFYMGDAEGDEFRYQLKIADKTATLTRISERGGMNVGPLEFSVAKVGDRMFAMEAKQDIDGRRPRAYLRQRTEDDYLMWLSGEEDLFLLVRAGGELPEPGAWTALGGRGLADANLTADSLTFKSRSDTSASPETFNLLPVTAEHGEPRAIAIPERGDSFLLYFVPITSDVYLLRNHEEEDYVLLYKGEGPSWIQHEIKARQGSKNESSSSKTSEAKEVK